MTDHIVEIAEGFWNVRGALRILGVLNVGTQCSLVRLATGRFVLLDSYTLEGDIKAQIFERTDGGAKIDAVYNLHPFHTLHVQSVATLLPHAKLYGTARHRARFPSLAWQPELTESAAFAQKVADDFELTVPEGVTLIPKNEQLHFGSVLAIHKQSRTLHVDDTLNFVPRPFKVGALRFHPTLRWVLEPRADAAPAFRRWAESLAARCETVEHVCAAHARLPGEAVSGSLAEQVRAALRRVERVLQRHEKRWSKAS